MIYVIQKHTHIYIHMHTHICTYLCREVCQRSRPNRYMGFSCLHFKMKGVLNIMALPKSSGHLASTPALTPSILLSSLAVTIPVLL